MHVLSFLLNRSDQYKPNADQIVHYSRRIVKLFPPPLICYCKRRCGTWSKHLSNLVGNELFTNRLEFELEFYIIEFSIIRIRAQNLLNQLSSNLGVLSSIRFVFWWLFKKKYCILYLESRYLYPISDANRNKRLKLYLS